MFPCIGAPWACYRVPCCEKLKRETPVGPRRVQDGLSGSPWIRAGTSKRLGQRSHARHPLPLGQPQLNVRGRRSRCSEGLFFPRDPLGIFENRSLMLCSSIKRPIFRSEIGILIFSPNRAAVTVIRIPRTFQKFFLAPRSVIRHIPTSEQKN